MKKDVLNKLSKYNTNKKNMYKYQQNSKFSVKIRFDAKGQIVSE